MPVWRRLAVMGLAVGTGCLPRVSLPPLPPRDAPVEQRRQALERYSPVEQPTPVTSRLNGAMYQKAPSPFVWLADGHEVWDPQDLAALLPPDSATARHASLFDDHLYTGRVVLIGGVGLVLIGFGLAYAGALQNPTSTSAPGFGLLVGGAAGMFAGMLTTIVGFLVSVAYASSDQRQAFESYPADLAAALGL